MPGATSSSAPAAAAAAAAGRTDGTGGSGHGAQEWQWRRSALTWSRSLKSRVVQMTTSGATCAGAPSAKPRLSLPRPRRRSRTPPMQRGAQPRSPTHGHGLHGKLQARKGRQSVAKWLEPAFTGRDGKRRAHALPTGPPRPWARGRLRLPLMGRSAVGLAASQSVRTPTVGHAPPLHSRACCDTDSTQGGATSAGVHQLQSAW